MSSRDIRHRVKHFIKKADLASLLEYLRDVPGKKAIKPLIAGFYDTEPAKRWTAISAFGKVVSDIANQNMEDARIIIRRLMWSLNDESGGIGWGAPEAMAEVLANNEAMAKEYFKILVSYIREDGNFLEYTPLRRGALWGIARLAEVSPALLVGFDTVRFLRPYLQDEDPESRALTVKAVGLLGSRSDCAGLKVLFHDNAPVRIYSGKGFMDMTVGEMAREAYGKLCG